MEQEQKVEVELEDKIQPQFALPELNLAAPRPESELHTDTWTLGGVTERLEVSFHGAEQRWQVSFSCSDGKIITSAYSVLELSTILHAIGTHRLWPRTETEVEAVARGLKITKCPTMYAWGGSHTQSYRRSGGNFGVESDTLGNLAAKAKPKRVVWTKKQLESMTLEDLLKGDGK